MNRELRMRGTANGIKVSLDVQQCRMLESSLGTSVLARCLNEPSEASSIVANREQIESDP